MGLGDIVVFVPPKCRMIDREGKWEYGTERDWIDGGWVKGGLWRVGRVHKQGRRVTAWEMLVGVVALGDHRYGRKGPRDPDGDASRCSSTRGTRVKAPEGFEGQARSG